MAAIKALQQWCRQQCEGYRDVNITNMTTSFRDGLAFCAILHRHKPDLINFNSLHKENVYENNHLAFRVAEEQLGIPALLDAEDMVNLRVPDRLSILTYVSQYYNYFHGRSPIGGMAAIKRPPSESSDEPVGKKAISETSPKSSRVHHPPTMRMSPVPAKRNMVTERSPVTTKKVLTENSNTSGMVSSSCAICKKHVHLVQRHLVDGKLYHRNCFRCSDCTSTLLSGTYTSGPKPGTFICTSHQYKTSIPGSGAIGTGSNKTGVNQSNATFSTSNSGHLNGTGSGKTGTVNLGFHLKNLESKKPLEEPVKSSQQNKSTSSASSFNSISSSSSPATSRWSAVGQKVIQSDDNTVPKPWTSSAAKTQAAREKFFQSISSPAAPSDNISVLSGREQSKTTQSAMPNKAIAGMNHYGVAAGTSEKDKARNFLLSALPGPSSSSASPSGSTSTSVQVTSRFSPSASHSQTTSPKMDSAKPEQTAKHAAAAGKPDRYSAVVEQKADAQPAKGSKSPDKSESPADWRSRLKPVEKGPGANRVPDLKEKWSPTSQTSAAVPRTLTTGSTVTVNINPSISGKENKPTPSSISSASVGTGLKENKPAQSSTSTANQKNAWKENKPFQSSTSAASHSSAWKENKPAQSSTSTANQNNAWKENKSAQSSTSIANQNSAWKENKPAQSSMSAANQNSAWKENKPAQSSTSTANQKNAWKENKPAQSSMSAANQNNAWKENKPSQSSTSAANHSSAPSKRTGWKEDKPTQSGTSSTSYIAAWKESKVSNSSISASSHNTPSKETKPAEPSTSPADQTTSETAPYAELPKKKKLLVANLDITKDWPEFQQNWQDTNVSRQREEPTQSRWPMVQPVAPQRPQKPPRAVSESPIKPHPDYIPEEKIQQQLHDIEKQLDELELKGIDLEKELRSCEGDEREDTLMVDWFKLIHEKQLLLRLESELMYKSKQQALEDQQIDVEKELRNLLSMPDNLKSPRQKARESELLEKYVNIVNDRSDIVDCLDEDRLREKEEDQMMEAMIQGLDLQRDSPESPKKKSKFRLSKIWKQKNVKTKAAE